MDVVVPVVKLGEVGESFGDVGELTRIGGMGLDGAEVGFDPHLRWGRCARVVVGLARAAKELGNAELLEILAGRVGPHLGTAIAERVGPLVARGLE